MNINTKCILICFHILILIIENTFIKNFQNIKKKKFKQLPKLSPKSYPHNRKIEENPTKPSTNVPRRNCTTPPMPTGKTQALCANRVAEKQPVSQQQQQPNK